MKNCAIFTPFGPGIANGFWEATCTALPLDERLGCSYLLAQILSLNCGRQAALGSHWLKELGCSYLLAQVSPIACGRLPALGSHWMKGWPVLTYWPRSPIDCGSWPALCCHWMKGWPVLTYWPRSRQ